MLYTGLKFNLDIFLGVTPEERRKLQIVNIIFELKKNIKQECLLNDNAKDYICYQLLTQEVHQVLNNTEIRLLEYLCYQVYSIIKAQVDNTLVNVVVKKECVDIVDDKGAEAYCKYIEFDSNL